MLRSVGLRVFGSMALGAMLAVELWVVKAEGLTLGQGACHFELRHGRDLIRLPVDPAAVAWG